MVKDDNFPAKDEGHSRRPEGIMVSCCMKYIAQFGYQNIYTLYTFIKVYEIIIRFREIQGLG